MVGDLLKSTAETQKKFQLNSSTFIYRAMVKNFDKKAQICTHVIPTGNGIHGIFGFSIDVFIVITLSTVFK